MKRYGRGGASGGDVRALCIDDDGASCARGANNSGVASRNAARAGSPDLKPAGPARGEAPVFAVTGVSRRLPASNAAHKAAAPKASARRAIFNRRRISFQLRPSAHRNVMDAHGPLELSARFFLTACGRAATRRRRSSAVADSLQAFARAPQQWQVFAAATTRSAAAAQGSGNACPL